MNATQRNVARGTPHHAPFYSASPATSRMCCSPRAACLRRNAGYARSSRTAKQPLSLSHSRADRPSAPGQRNSLSFVALLSTNSPRHANSALNVDPCCTVSHSSSSRPARGRRCCCCTACLQVVFGPRGIAPFQKRRPCEFT